MYEYTGGAGGLTHWPQCPWPTWWYLQQQAHCPARWWCPSSSDPLEGVGDSSVPKGTGQTCIGAAVKYRRLLSRASSTSRLWTTTPALRIPGSGTVHQGPQGASGGPHSLIVHYGTLCFLPVPVCKLPQVSCMSSPHPRKPPHPGLGSGFASWRSKLRQQEIKNSEPQLMKLKRDAHFRVLNEKWNAKESGSDSTAEWAVCRCCRFFFFNNKDTLEALARTEKTGGRNRQTLRLQLGVTDGTLKMQMNATL